MYDPEKDTLIFQCKDILSRDAFPDSPLDSDDDRRSIGSAGKMQKMYQILLFGTDPQGESVALQITNFKPYFYVRIPDCLAANETAKKNLQSWILDGVPQESLYAVALDYTDHGVLIDYNGGNKGTFLKITVPTIALWRTLKDRVLDKASTPIGYDTRSLFGIGAIAALAKHTPTGDIHSATLDGKRVALKVYEANIDPVLRFFHLQDISPAGWVKVPENHWEIADSDDAKVKVYAVAEWTDVQPAEDTGMAPFLIGSWDIECNSAHGDFPIAIKNWKKPVREFQETGIPNTLQEMVQQLANAIAGKPGKLSPIYINTRKHHLPITAESLTKAIQETKREGQFKNGLAALRVAENADARDKAVTMFDKLLTSTFPPIAGDEIIQIGIVLYRKTKPISKHVWVLNSVDETTVRPPGELVPIEVYSYMDEATLLRAWFQWLGKTDPDILIGYNIFGFDSKYIWDRLAELVGEKETSRLTSPLSCLKSRPTKLEEKFLSSSAMGDNTMHFMNQPRTSTD
jgi:DNA polymerase elongation subunit (family B)